jgi:hypothetical protein
LRGREEPRRAATVDEGRPDARRPLAPELRRDRRLVDDRKVEVLAACGLRLVERVGVEFAARSQPELALLLARPLDCRAESGFQVFPGAVEVRVIGSEPRDFTAVEKHAARPLPPEHGLPEAAAA